MARSSEFEPRMDANAWLLAWDHAMMRISGAPTTVRQQPAFEHALEMLDRGFANGDVLQFHLAVLMLVDCCDNAIETGG